MKRIFFTILVTLFLTSVNSQVVQSRILKVNPANVDKFETAVAKKTKMYNSKKGQPRWVTFQILTGPNAWHYVRMQIAQSVGEFDNVDKVGNAYWQKNVGPLHSSEGNSMWKISKNATYTPKVPKRLNHRRIIFYNYKQSHRKNFWRFRNRSKNTLEQMGYENRVGVMYCVSGCNGNWVQVRFHNKDFTGEDENWKKRPKFIEKYEELYGEGSHEEDLDRMYESLMLNGRRIRHVKRLPELSSPWN